MALSAGSRMIAPIIRRPLRSPKVLASFRRRNNTVPTPPPPSAKPDSTLPPPPPHTPEPPRQAESSGTVEPRFAYDSENNIWGIDANGMAIAPPVVTTAIAIPDEFKQFIGPARHRLLNDRKTPRPLPPHPNNWLKFSIYGSMAVASWVLFCFWAFNLGKPHLHLPLQELTSAERASSSVVAQLKFILRNSVDVADLFGENVQMEPPPWKYGEPYVAGKVNNMQGRVDVKFRIFGKKEHGTVYFTSIRTSQHDPWRILRFKAVTDGGEELRMEDKIEKF